MRVLLSSNPYRDRGLRVALEARRILNNAGAETALCLPFAPRKGDRLDLPRQVKLGSMEEELKRADVLLCFGGRRDHPPRGPGRHPPRRAHPGGEHGERGLYGGAGAGRAEPAHPAGRRRVSDRGADDALRPGAPGGEGALGGPGPERRGDLQGLHGPGGRDGGPGGRGAGHQPDGGWGHRLHPHRFHRLLHVAGGPIVEPTSRDIIVTPVCAHQLSTRSMVLAPERLVTVQLPRGSRKHLYLAVDGGKALRITGTERVEISCARQSTRLIRLTERNFYQIIYQKLGGYEL